MSSSDTHTLTMQEEPAATSSPVETSPISEEAERRPAMCYVTTINQRHVEEVSVVQPGPCSSRNQDVSFQIQPPNQESRNPLRHPTKIINRTTSAPLTFVNTVHPVPFNQNDQPDADEERPVSVTAWAENMPTQTVVMDLHVPFHGLFSRDKVSSIGGTSSFLQNIRTLIASGLSPFSSSPSPPPSKCEDIDHMDHIQPCSTRFTLRRSSSCGEDFNSIVNFHRKEPQDETTCSTASLMSRTLSEPALLNLYFDSIMPSAFPPFKLPHAAGEMSSYNNTKLASRSSSVEERFCRICWGGDDLEPCIQPCYCSTTVHESCMQKWLQIANSFQCEVCQYRFKSKVMLKPVSQWRWWLNKNRNMAQLEATILLLGIVTPPLLCGIILCSQKIAEYLRDPNNAWKTAGLMTLVLISVVTYLAAMIYFLVKFGTVCKLWLAVNRTTVIYIVPLTEPQRRPWLQSVTVVGKNEANDDTRVWSIT